MTDGVHGGSDSISTGAGGTGEANATGQNPKQSVVRIVRIDRLPAPSRYPPAAEDAETRKSLRFTKLEAWRLTHYAKVVFIDADTLVLRPIDSLFTCPPGSAAGDMGAPGHFNSGVFVLERPEFFTDERFDASDDGRRWCGLPCALPPPRLDCRGICVGLLVEPEVERQLAAAWVATLTQASAVSKRP